MPRIIIALMLMSASFLINAHPGRTAEDGCHYCRTNCDKWNVPFNVRHCHAKKKSNGFNGQNKDKPKLSKYAYYTDYSYEPVDITSFYQDSGYENLPDFDPWSTYRSDEILKLKFKSDDVSLYHTYIADVTLDDGGYGAGYDIYYQDLFVLKYKRDSSFNINAVEVSTQEHLDDKNYKHYGFKSESISFKLKDSKVYAITTGYEKSTRIYSDGEYDYVEFLVDRPDKVGEKRFSMSFVASGKRTVDSQSLEDNAVDDYLLAHIDFDYNLITDGINIDYDGSYRKNASKNDLKVFTPKLYDGAIKAVVGTATKGRINTVSVSTFADSANYHILNDRMDDLSSFTSKRIDHTSVSNKVQNIPSYSEEPIVVDGLLEDWNELSHATTIEEEMTDSQLKYTAYEVHSENGPVSYIGIAYSFNGESASNFFLKDANIELVYRNHESKIFKEMVNSPCYSMKVNGGEEDYNYCPQSVSKILKYRLGFRYDKGLDKIVLNRNGGDVRHASYYDGKNYYLEVVFPVRTPQGKGLINTEWAPHLSLTATNSRQPKAAISRNIAPMASSSIVSNLCGSDCAGVAVMQEYERVKQEVDMGAVQINATVQYPSGETGISYTTNFRDASLSTSESLTPSLNADLEAEFSVIGYNTSDLSAIDTGDSFTISVDNGIVGVVYTESLDSNVKGVGVTAGLGGRVDADAGVTRSYVILHSDERKPESSKSSNNSSSSRESGSDRSDGPDSETLRDMRSGSSDGSCPGPIGGNSSYGFG